MMYDSSGHLVVASIRHKFGCSNLGSRPLRGEASLFLPMTRFCILSTDIHLSLCTLYCISLMAQPIAITSAAIEFNPPNEIANLDFWEQDVLSNLDDAIAYYQNALELYPPDHPDRSVCLFNIATSLSFRFQQQKEITDIEMSISLHRMTLDLLPSNHPDYSSTLHNLAASLQTKYEHQEQSMLSDVDEAILLGRQALNLRPPGHVYRSVTLNNLAISLQTRFKEQGVASDIDEAIEFGRVALELRSPSHPCHLSSIDNLSTSLLLRYEDGKDASDLNEVIRLQRDALEICPDENLYRSKCLSALASSLRRRFECQGEFTDLDETISLHREALDLRPIGHPNRARSLHELTISLELRFKRKSTSEDLDEAVFLQRAAVDLYPRDHCSQPINLSNLAATLQTRFYHRDIVSDLDEAIAVFQEAMELCPLDHAFRPLLINNLAVGLQTRYKREHTARDLDEAIVFHQTALELCFDGHSQRSVSVFNLALCTKMRYHRDKSSSDLDESVRLYREVLVLRPEGHPDRSEGLAGLAAVLCVRCKRNKLISDLNEAIGLQRAALDLRPHGHHHRFSRLHELAQSLLARFKVHGHTTDFDEAFRLYSELSRIPLSVSLDDVKATRSWVSAAEKFKHESGLTAYCTALQFILRHTTSIPSSVEQFQRVKQAMSSIPMDAFSYCLRHGMPKTAVELLDQGRMVFWNQFSRLRLPREDLSALERAEPTLTEEYEKLSEQLKGLFDKPGDLQTPETRALMSQLDNLISRVREVPNFSNFLSPLPFSDLRAAARDGPVIIVNASSHTCDALIVLATCDPVHIPLNITMDKVSRLASDFRSLTAVDVSCETSLYTEKTEEPNTIHGEGEGGILLETILCELRDLVVNPIIHALQGVASPSSRIWWCPSAEFMTLPLHAAASYAVNDTSSGASYISSYTPSLFALIQARKHLSGYSSDNLSHFAAVGAGELYRNEDLVVVGQKLEVLAARSESIGEKTTRTHIEGEAATIESVTRVLGNNHWIHLTCQYNVNPKQPFESALVLHDGRLTINKIIQGELANSFFAFLLASESTSVVDADVPDEAIHIAAALYFTGFPSIVATLGVIDDQCGHRIASAFYDNLFEASNNTKYPQIAEALQKTMSTLGNEIPLQQRVCFMHIGV